MELEPCGITIPPAAEAPAPGETFEYVDDTTLAIRALGAEAAAVTMSTGTGMMNTATTLGKMALGKLYKPQGRLG